jgi:uncharacterized protein YbaP (TraB family)
MCISVLIQLIICHSLIKEAAMKNPISYAKKLIIASCILCASVSFADTSLFEVTNKQGETIYLGGTIHLMRPSDFPLPDEFQQTFDKTDVLVLEADLQKASSPEFGLQMMQMMMYRDGKNLSLDLRPEVWKELQDYATQNQIPVGQYMQFKPFMACLLMVIHHGQKSGLTAGVDAYFNQQARMLQKKTGELESSEEILAFMETMNDQDPNSMVISTLRDLKSMDEMMVSLTKAWRAGDLATIEKEMLKPMKKEFPETYKIMVLDRNNKWMEKIQAMFKTPEKEMVLVGSLHLVGEDGLIKQLKSRGYKVKAVTAEKTGR